MDHDDLAVLLHGYLEFPAAPIQNGYNSMKHVSIISIIRAMVANSKVSIFL